MEFTQMLQPLKDNYPERIITIDSHIAGEPARLIVGGVGSLPGETMQAKREYFIEHYDHIRLLLTREPRGQNGECRAGQTEAVQNIGRPRRSVRTLPC